jgi:hypothetical protein
MTCLSDPACGKNAARALTADSRSTYKEARKPRGRHMTLFRGFSHTRAHREKCLNSPNAARAARVKGGYPPRFLSPPPPRKPRDLGILVRTGSGWIFPFAIRIRSETVA